MRVIGGGWRMEDGLTHSPHPPFTRPIPSINIYRTPFTNNAPPTRRSPRSRCLESSSSSIDARVDGRLFGGLMFRRSSSHIECWGLNIISFMDGF